MFDPYGKVTICNPDGSEKTGVARVCSAFGNPFFFTGRRNDDETRWFDSSKPAGKEWQQGLMQFRFRYYDTGLGRFLNRNLWGYAHEFLSLYDYVDNQPSEYMEPFSHKLGPRPLNPLKKYTSRSDDWVDWQPTGTMNITTGGTLWISKPTKQETSGHFKGVAFWFETSYRCCDEGLWYQVVRSTHSNGSHKSNDGFRNDRMDVNGWHIDSDDRKDPSYDFGDQPMFDGPHVRPKMELIAGLCCTKGPREGQWLVFVSYTYRQADGLDPKVGDPVWPQGGGVIPPDFKSAVLAGEGKYKKDGKSVEVRCPVK